MTSGDEIKMVFGKVKMMGENRKSLRDLKQQILRRRDSHEAELTTRFCCEFYRDP